LLRICCGPTFEASQRVCCREDRVKALLVWPRFPTSYWGQEYVLPIIRKGAVLPPLGLITAAALLPSHWQLRVVDLNLEPLEDGDLAWADVVMLSAMRVQRESFREVVARARALGKRVVAGGPYVTTDPDGVEGVDHMVLGEAEEVLPELARRLEAGEPAPARQSAPQRPDVTRTPLPRFDLLKVNRYDCMSVQFSRGCPFACEFCDIIEIFGRVPRTKTPEQFLAELEALRATGFRGPVFVVDDNFIGNKVAARKMLGHLAGWNREHQQPFVFFTEASVNLADDDRLIEGLVAAGFSAIFVGIETPSREALLETQKRQNTHLDLELAVEKLVRSGLEVMAGFIVGFDADDETIFERQYQFIARSPISMAMIGILTALPGTQLWRRLAAEGRLHGDSEGDAAYRPNFATRLPEPVLLEGYRRLLARVYEPRAYFARALRTLSLQRHSRQPPFRRSLGYSVGALLRSVWRQGLRGSYRAAYWRFLAQAAWTAPGHFAEAVALAIHGEHMIRYTFEDVLPRLTVPAPAHRLAPLAERLVPLRRAPFTPRSDTSPAPRRGASQR
jgi:radical SAM superfamily enzyme YgiQ (UPF0313 family)